MSSYSFYIVDVFAEKKYAGNSLAVFLNTQGLSDTEMQQITREMNYSETTFIRSFGTTDGGYDVRIFTPRVEVPFAGHPTLGTAYVILEEIIRKPSELIILNLKVGQIPVTVSYRDSKIDMLWMKQNSPSFGRVMDPEAISSILNLEKNEIDDKFPIQDVSTGSPFMIVPLKTLASLKRARVARERYFAFFKDTPAEGMLVFCPEAYRPEDDLSVRVFAEHHGIPEDAATGSGNGCLAAYLVKYRYFGKTRLDIRVGQGYEISRPSLLSGRAEEGQEGIIDVSVGGRVVMVAKGELF
jgi:trans-2,3-dihydro-3-hydroxyanthranilate isomerase